MTAILAAKVGRRYLLGADRALTAEDTGAVALCATPKILRLGEYLVGVAGSLGGWWEALPVVCPYPECPADVLTALGPGPNAEALIARGGRLWDAYWDGGDAPHARWSLLEVAGDVAIGSGGAWAQGAWEGMRGTKIPPEKRMLRALQISAQCCNSVRGPFDVLWA